MQPVTFRQCLGQRGHGELLSSFKTERRIRSPARAEVFDHIERFYNPRRRHSTERYVSPVAFEEQMQLAKVRVYRTGGSSTFQN